MRRLLTVPGTGRSAPGTGPATAQTGQTGTGTGRAAEFDPDHAYEKHPAVAIRPEGFGGLAYHYGNRRLVFLKAPELVSLVESLAEFASARDALAACVRPPRRAATEQALARLLASDVIRRRDSGSCRDEKRAG